MPEKKRFQCLNCGHRFEADVLTQEEKEERRRRDRGGWPTSVHRDLKPESVFPDAGL